MKCCGQFTPSGTSRGSCSTWRRRVLDADWCLHPNAVANSHVFRQITGFLLQTLMAIGASEPDPFGDAGCRLKLYRVFRASILVASSAQATCIPHAVIIFGNGLQDASDEIRYFCTDALAVLDQLIHPIVGSLPRRSQVSSSRHGSADWP